MEEGDIRKRIRAILRENYDWIDDQEELYPEDLFGDESIQAMRDMEDEYGKENVAKFGDHEDVRKFVRDVTKPKQVAESVDNSEKILDILKRYPQINDLSKRDGKIIYYLPYDSTTELSLLKIPYKVIRITNHEHKHYKKLCAVVELDSKINSAINIGEAIVTDDGIEGGLEAEMSPEDQTFYLKRIVNKYKAHGEKIGSQGSPFEMRYWIPFEAANELRLAQIQYEIDKVTNKEHSDYGKRFCVVIWGKV